MLWMPSDCEMTKISEYWFVLAEKVNSSQEEAISLSSTTNVVDISTVKERWQCLQLVERNPANSHGIIYTGVRHFHSLSAIFLNIYHDVIGTSLNSLAKSADNQIIIHLVMDSGSQFSFLTGQVADNSELPVEQSDLEILRIWPILNSNWIFK